MANRVFQNVVYQMKDAIDRVVGVVDETGAVIACSELGQIGEMREGFAVARLTAGDAFEKDGYAYHQFSNAKHNDYAVFVEGNDPTAAQFASLLSISLQSIKQYHDEKFDKANFIKNVVLDNILPGDIYAKARELHFATDVSRVVFIVRVTSGGDISAYDVVSSLFPDKQKDFVFNISETDTVLVKEIRKGIDRTDMEKLAASIVDTLSGEHYIKAVVGIGTPIANVKDLATSFKEAQIAMEVSKVFDTEKQIIRYDNLGIARLIYQLPTTVCEMFLREVFKQGSIESLDQEYERHERLAGESHYPLSKMLALAFDGITSLSNKPIRIITGAGIVVSLIGFIGVIWAIVQAILGSSVAGWASIVCIVCFMGGVQLVCLGVIGEYIGKIYMETKARPRYIISERTWAPYERKYHG